MRGEVGSACKDDSHKIEPLKRLATLLLQLGADASLFKMGQVFDEHSALQVIHLMLDTHREQTIRL